MLKDSVICLMGTTATGKTDAAAAIYDSFESEIISVDSSLVYRDMNIGTAKPDVEFLNKYPHHLVDIRDPSDTYSVADFYDDCRPLIGDIIARGKTPILVGGTQFYFNSLEQGLARLPKADPNLRADIAREAQKYGWPQLHAKLAALDPISASRIDSNDAQRVQRALEIVISGGKPVAAYEQNRKPPLAQRLIKIALNFSDRQYLHRRIEQRFEAMLEAGLESEVASLLDKGLTLDNSSMRMIGYRQMFLYLRGDLTKTDMREQGISATRQLAKRQFTWLRNQANVIWWTDFGLRQKEYGPLIEFVYQFTKKPL